MELVIRVVRKVDRSGARRLLVAPGRHEDSGLDGQVCLGGLGAVNKGRPGIRSKVRLSTYFRDLQVHGGEAGKSAFSKSNFGFAGEYGVSINMSSKLGNS